MTRLQVVPLIVATGLIAGCASTPPSAAPVEAPMLTPGTYLAEDDSQTWVFWPNGMYERSVAQGDAPARVDWGQWWTLPNQSSVIAHGGEANPTVLNVSDATTLTLPRVGQAASATLERDDDAEPLPQDRSMQVCFMTVADAPLAYDPQTLRNWPVAMAAAYPQLESAYRESGLRPPARLPVRISGHWIEGEAPDAGGEQLYLRVNALERVMDLGAANCPSTTLQGNYWVLTRLNGQTVSRDDGQREIFMQFGQDQRVSGLAGCNRFSGPYERRRDDLSLGPLATTRLMCPGRAATENALLAALKRTGRFAIEGKQLFLMTPEGEVMAVLEAHDLSDAPR